MEKDKLTGLLLFDGFLDFAKKYLEDSDPEDHIVIVSTDLSKFKYINRVYGFASGDVLIRKLAELFMGREECVAACRPYSDHIIGLFNLKQTEVQRCFDCARMLQSKFVLENKADYSKASIHLNTGIYEIIDREEEITSAIDKANIARRSVKGNYSVPCAIYTEEMQKRREGDEKIIPLFEKSIEERSILVYFQPKVSVKENRVVGAEALTRLQNEDGSVIPPDVFIPVLESSGKILELDWYVMRFVFCKISEWLSNGKQPQKISVNLSKIHFYYDTLVDDIIKEFELHHISPEYVEFEITESVFFEEADLIISKIERLREYGFKVSVDDFGAGYSSLNLIGILPVDIIKLDKRFVKNSLGNKKGKDIIKGLISILNEIDMDIVCEGIETKEEERIVYEFGCDSMQGYLYDRPIPVSDYEKKYIQ